MFKVSGVSKFNGEVKVRFANDMTRVKILAKNGHTDINLLELPNEMDKPEIVKFLLTTELAQTPEYKEAIEDAVEKYNSTKVAKTAVLKTGTKEIVAKKTTAKPKAKAGGTASLADLQARAAAKEVPAE